MLRIPPSLLPGSFSLSSFPANWTFQEEGKSLGIHLARSEGKLLSSSRGDVPAGLR